MIEYQHQRFVKDILAK